MNISGSFEDGSSSSSSVGSSQRNPLGVVVVGPYVGERSVEAAGGSVPALKVSVDVGGGDDGL